MSERDEEGQPRLWSPVFVLIIALTLCCFLMGQGLNSGTSVFLVGEGYGSAFAGALALAFSAAAAASRITVGPVIDSGRCSAVIIAGIVVLIAGTFMSSVVQGIPLFTVSRLLQGAGFGAATTAASTAAANVLPAARLGEGIGYHGLGQALSMSIGPALALYLVGTDPATNLYVGLSLVGVVGLLVALNARYEHKWRKLPPTCAYRRMMEEREQAPADMDVPQQPAKRTLRDALNIFEPRALPGAIPMTILCPTFGFGIFFTGLYGTTLGYEHAGLFYTFSAVSMVLVRLCSKSFMDTVPPIKTYTVAVACALVQSGMLLAAPMSEAIFLASGVLYGLALGISLPLNQSVAVKNTPPERWGATNALFLLANDIGIGLSSLIWGAINDAWGFQASILCIIACQVLSYVAAWLVYPADAKRWKRH
ncbi:MAG: MFS transporter [Coriobacteriales bacterium]